MIITTSITPTTYRICKFVSTDYHTIARDALELDVRASILSS